MADDQPDPSQHSSDYDAQAAFWATVEAILGGEETIKAGTTTYLPKFAGETQATYDYRLENAPFTNIYADISKNLASKPFSKELGMDESTPEQYRTLAENIDGQGNNHHVFASTAWKRSQDKGIDWILVDATKARPRADGRALSLADEKQQALRPYWLHISAEQMVAVYSSFINGKETIFHARWVENSTQLEGFDEVAVQRVRVFKRDPIIDSVTGAVIGYLAPLWEVWEERAIDPQPTSGKKTKWVMIDTGVLTIPEIPLVPVVLTEREGASWIVTPPLRDLASMQLAEYRQEANLEWVKIMTCYPMVAISGLSTDETKDADLTVGPNKVFLIPQNGAGTGPAGEVKIVEPGAQSIVENRAQLELTRKEMRDLGMAPMTQVALTVVTTANVSKKASSAVQAWAFRFKDALEQAWRFTAMWLGDKSFEPEVVIHTDFAIEIEDASVPDALLKSEGQGIFSKQTIRAEFKRRDWVVNDLTDEEEDQRIAEQQQGLEGEQQIDPRTGKPIVQAAAA